MKVFELIELLQDMDPEDEVVILDESGENKVGEPIDVEDGITPKVFIIVDMTADEDA